MARKEPALVTLFTDAELLVELIKRLDNLYQDMGNAPFECKHDILMGLDGSMIKARKSNTEQGKIWLKPKLEDTGFPELIFNATSRDTKARTKGKPFRAELIEMAHKYGVDIWRLYSMCTSFGVPRYNNFTCDETCVWLPTGRIVLGQLREYAREPKRCFGTNLRDIRCDACLACKFPKACGRSSTYTNKYATNSDWKRYLGFDGHQRCVKMYGEVAERWDTITKLGSWAYDYSIDKFVCEAKPE